MITQRRRRAFERNSVPFLICLCTARPFVQNWTAPFPTRFDTSIDVCVLSPQDELQRCTICIRDGVNGQSMSIPMDCPSPGISALRAEGLTLIFSRTGEVEVATGSTSFVETDSLFATFRRCALTFSLATAILWKGHPIRDKATPRAI